MSSYNSHLDTDLMVGVDVTSDAVGITLFHWVDGVIEILHTCTHHAASSESDPGTSVTNQNNARESTHTNDIPASHGRIQQPVKENDNADHRQ